MDRREEDLRAIERIRAGDRRALEELYDRYADVTYGTARRILRDPSDAEEAFQDAWLQAWRRAGTYDAARGSVVSWLLTLARTRALDRWRRASAHRKAVEAAEPEPAGADAGPHEDAVRRELRKKLGGALESLDAKQRQVLEIAYFEGLTQSEIAERLATPLGTIKYWTRQGLLKLREALPGDVWP